MILTLENVKLSLALTEKLSRDLSSPSVATSREVIMKVDRLNDLHSTVLTISYVLSSLKIYKVPSVILDRIKLRFL